MKIKELMLQTPTHKSSATDFNFTSLWREVPFWEALYVLLHMWNNNP